MSVAISGATGLSANPGCRCAHPGYACDAEEAQHELLQSVDDIESRHDLVYRLSDEEREAVERGLADMRAGRFASDEAVTALFKRYLA
ncbi:hypothetical protein [Rhodopseudomonas palustris]|uniref:hypothetical protein n=1 Tax=Rhodopseudomonas palustris TaxID=1076 RepID=UPI00059EE059